MSAKPESKASSAEAIRRGWDIYFIEIARQIATRGTCLRGKVGALFVRDRHILATGYNGAPSGMPHCTDIGVGCQIYRVENPDGGFDENCYRVVHAEMNAIAQAARNGSSIISSSLYCTYSPCIHCIKVLANTGIAEIYYEKPYRIESIMDVVRASGILRVEQVQMS